MQTGESGICGPYHISVQDSSAEEYRKYHGSRRKKARNEMIALSRVPVLLVRSGLAAELCCDFIQLDIKLGRKRAPSKNLIFELLLLLLWCITIVSSDARSYLDYRGRQQAVSSSRNCAAVGF